MPRQPKKPPEESSRKPGETVQSQFRLSADSLADLETILAHLAGMAGGVPLTRSDAIRHALHETAKKIPKKSVRNT